VKEVFRCHEALFVDRSAFRAPVADQAAIVATGARTGKSLNRRTMK
jgi:hypothetical protein